MVFEGDCLRVISVPNTQSTSADCLCNFIHDICYLLQLVLGWSIKFNFKKTNSATHMLAQHACNIIEDYIWVDDYPSLIEDIGQNEKLCNTFDV